jgi:hypothetical protein
MSAKREIVIDAAFEGGKIGRQGPPVSGIGIELCVHEKIEVAKSLSPMSFGLSDFFRRRR